MPPLKRPLKSQYLRLVLRYQHEHPETSRGGQSIPGRINLHGRKSFQIDVARLLIEEEGVRKIILDTNISDANKPERIADFTLKKFGNDKAASTLFLNGVCERMKSASPVNYALLKKVARKNKLDENIYAGQTDHMMSKSIWIMLLPLWEAMEVIKKK